jgi:hypothetical protein
MAEQEGGAAIEAYYLENRTFPPPAAFKASALVTDARVYDDAEADWAGHCAGTSTRTGPVLRPSCPLWDQASRVTCRLNRMQQQDRAATKGGCGGHGGSWRGGVGGGWADGGSLAQAGFPGGWVGRPGRGVRVVR